VASTGGGLKVVDISNPYNPSIIGSCDDILSARSMDISGDYAYVTDYNHGLRIIDISNPASPFQTAFLPLSGRTRLIEAFGNYVYITRHRTLFEQEGETGIRIVDVSNPYNPIERALFQPETGFNEPCIDATGQFLIVPSGRFLRVYDVTDPDAPSEVAVYEGDAGTSLATVVGDHAYVAFGRRLDVLDISDINTITPISSYWFDDPVSLMYPVVAGNLCFINSWYESLRIVDFSDFNSPQEVGSYDIVGLLDFADVADDHAYMVNSRIGHTDALKILDLSNLSDIKETATAVTPYYLYGVKVSEGHAYLPAWNDGLRAIAISDPSNPLEVGAYEDLERARDIVISGKYAYIADGWDGLRVFDISSPSNPDFVGTCRTDGYVYQVAISGDHAYLAANRGGLRIIDISDPMNPWEIGSYEFDGRAYNVGAAGDYAYVHDRYQTLRIIDVSDPANPFEVSSLGMTYLYGDIGISGNYIFVPDWTFGVRVIDVSNPANPTEIEIFRGLPLPEEVIVRDNYIYVVNRDTGLYVLEFRTPGPEQTISGKVVLSGSPLQGVVLEGLPEETMTNGLGDYSATVPTGWTGTVTPRLDGYFFIPPTRTYNNVTTDQLNQNYVSLAGEPLQITTTGLPGGVVDEAYSGTLEAIGGTAPYFWSIVSGSFPEGLNLDTGTGEISGTPTESGDFTFTVQVTDSGLPPQSVFQEFSLRILNTYTLNVDVNPGESGSVTKNPDKARYVEGEVVELNATANAGYTFTEWSGQASGSINPLHVPMLYDKHITANFASTVDLPDYTINSFTAPSSANAGEIIGGEVSLSVENQGAHDLYSGDISVGIYLSSDTVITTGDIPLWKGKSSISPLGSGEIINVTIDPELQIPNTVAGGDYYIGVIVDETNVIIEQDKNNNDSSQSISLASIGEGSFDIVGSWSGGATYGLAVDEARNFALIGHGGDLEIWDYSDPSNLVKRSELFLSSSLLVSMVTSGNLAYIASGHAGLKVVDFSDPDNLVEIGSCDTFQSYARSVDVSGDYAYVTDYHHGLRVIDISTPTSPTEIAFMPFPYLTREVKVFGNYAYVSVRVHIGGGEGEPALRIIDISDPANPVLRSTTVFQSAVGIPAMDDSGQYLFVPTSAHGMRILDVSNPDAPSEVAFYDGVTNPTEVMIIGNRAYLDDHQDCHVVILDISDVLNPVEISSYWFENRQSLYGFEVAGNLWFVNRWYDSIKILDFSDLNAPYEVGSYDDTQGLMIFVEVSDDHAYIVNNKSYRDRLKVLDISDLSNITEATTFETPSSIYEMDMSGNYVYLAAWNDGLVGVDITYPSNPVQASALEEHLRNTRDVVVSGNYAYVARGWGGLRIVDVSTPTNPVLVSHLFTPGYAWSLALSGNYLYVANHRNGLRIVDVSDPLNPWEVGAIEFGDNRIRRVAASGNYAYVTEEYKTLRVIDASDPANPVEASSFDIYYPVTKPVISGHLLFVSDWLLGLRVMDVSDPYNPTQVALINEIFGVEQIAIRDNRIYALNRDSGLCVLEFQHAVSGEINFDGAPLQGVVMSGLPGEPTTNAQGEYIAGVPTGWTGTVMPTLAGYFFIPSQRVYETVTSNRPDQDYTAYVGDPLIITTTWLPDGIVTIEYNETLEATGGTSPYAWSVASGALPAGLSLNSSTGVISGIPSASGNFTFTIQVTDLSQPPQSFTQEFSININAYAGPGHIISGTVTADGLPLDGVVMNGLPENPTTNTSGFYMVVVEDGWSGKVVPIPNKAGYAFDPPSRNYVSVNSHQIDQNYEATMLTVEWVSRYDGPAANSSDSVAAMATDSSGNIYVTGTSSGGVTMDDYTTIKYDSAGDQVWVARYHNPESDSTDHATDMAVDSSGNVYVTGYYGYGGLNYDYMTIKYDSSGKQVWTVRYNGPENSVDRAVAIAVDSSGNVYVTGESYGSDTRYDYATIKYDSAGGQVWVARYNGPGNGYDRPVDITVDSSGNVYVTGESYGDGTDYDYATIKYDSNGDQNWEARHDGPTSSRDEPIKIAVDSSGNVYVTGSSRRSETYYDYATIKYDSTGSQTWIAWYDNNSQYDEPQAIALDSSGYVYVTGYSRGSYPNYDYATVKYNSAGVEQWAATYDGPENDDDRANAITVDTAGNVYVTGRSRGSNEFNEYATIKYDTGGNELWVRRYDGSANGNDQAYFIVRDSSGNIVVTGTSHGSSTGNDYATIKYDSSGNQLWLQQYNGPTNDDYLNWFYGDITAMDSSENIYISAYSYGNGTGNDYATVKFDSSGNQLWEARYNGLGNYHDYAQGMDVDSSGNVYVTGYTYTNGINRDYATVKYSSLGEQLWSATYDGPVNGDDSASAIAVDSLGNVYVTGESNGGETSGVDCVTIKYNSTGGQLEMARYDGLDHRGDEGVAVVADTSGNVYVGGYSYGDFLTIKYDSNLNELWHATYDSPDNGSDYVYFIALDSSNNVYVCGQSDSDYAVVKYDGSTGEELWAARYDGPVNGSEIPLGLALDSEGNAYVTGLSSGGDTRRNFATVKYDGNNGNELWVARYYGESEQSNDYGVGIAVDSTGNVYVTGRSGGSDTYYNTNCVTIKYDTDGNQLWLMKYDAPDNSKTAGISISVASNGDVYVMGSCYGNVPEGWDIMVLKIRQ
jgi:uncharacterized delta-60 repeat protein